MGSEHSREDREQSDALAAADYCPRSNDHLLQIRRNLHKVYRIVCGTCNFMGPPANSPKEAAERWNNLVVDAKR